ncbi:glucose-6-phosphate dehydrogenase, partial [Actinoplanes sp. NPDC049548]
MTTQSVASADNEQTLLVLGASGDLTARLLLPGLGGLLAESPGKRLFLVGSGRDDWTDAQWRQRVTEAFSSSTGPQVTATVQ